MPRRHGWDCNTPRVRRLFQLFIHNIRQYLRLQGTWRVTAVELDGKKIDVENSEKPVFVVFPQVSKPLVLDLLEIRIVIQGNQITVNEKQRGAVFSAICGLDVTGKEGKTDTKVADIVRHSKPGRQLVNKAIYTLDERDLKFCYAQVGKERPINFETKPNAGITLLVLKRQ